MIFNINSREYYPKHYVQYKKQLCPPKAGWYDNMYNLCNLNKIKNKIPILVECLAYNYAGVLFINISSKYINFAILLLIVKSCEI